MTSNFCPSWTISEGCLIRRQVMSVTWSKPSTPSRSKNTPKSVMFLTTPIRTSFGWMHSRSSAFFEMRSASRSSRRETTTFLRSALILSILKSNVLSRYSSRFLILLLSICEPGKNASIPISTINPPFTLRRTRPRTMDPSSQCCMICSHCLMRSAFSRDNTICPWSSSARSKRTSISLPKAISSASENSAIGTSPSDFNPTSTTT